MSMLAILLLAQAASGALALAPCTVPGSTETLRCGTLSVPEDGSAGVSGAGGHRIRLSR